MASEAPNCIVATIRSFEAEQGYSPSFKELGESCGISIATVHYWLSRLKSDGIVDYLPGRARTLVLREDRP